MFHLNLRKVVQADGASKTSVNDAAYSLVWVNRTSDARRAFQLVPVLESGVDSALVQSAIYRELMHEFVLDARTLLEKENKGVRERRKLPDR